MICLNSAGDLARSEVQVKKKGRESEDPPPLFLSRIRDSASTRPLRPARETTESGATTDQANPSALARERDRNLRREEAARRSLQGTPLPGRRPQRSRPGGKKSRAARNTTERSDGRAPGDAGSAICVQRLDDSLNSAIHTRYRSLLRSSSMHEPRGPPLEVVHFFFPTTRRKKNRHFRKKSRGGEEDGGATEAREFRHLGPTLPARREPPPSLALPRAGGERVPPLERCTWVSAKNQRR